jgi:cell shape-determining protein MreD
VRRDYNKWPRALATLVLGLFMVVLGTTVFSWWTLGPLRLEPLTALVVAAGYRLPLIMGFLVVWTLAYLTDLVSGGLMGLTLVSYSVVYVACTLGQRKLQIDSWPFQMLAVGLMSVLHHLLVLGGLYLTRQGYAPAANPALLLAAQALLSALTAPIFLALLEGLTALLARFWPEQRKAGS